MTDAREIARLVQGNDFTVASALALTTPEAVNDAIRGYEDLAPLSESDPHLADPRKRSAGAASIITALSAIGAKLEPSMDQAKVNAWRDGVLLSLSSWPGPVALAAARAGVHERFKYGIKDVDARLHELAEEISERNRNALYRLRRMRDEIERARNPPPAIEEQPHLWTADEVAVANRAFEKLGILTRYRLVGTEVETFQAEGVASVNSDGYIGATEGNPETHHAHD